MKVAIMQPYFLPYIGYFQLISAVDVFIVYDNIKYTKKGWINRNRMLKNEKDTIFSLPLKKDSDALNVVQRCLSIDFNRGKLLKSWHDAYERAPYFAQTFPVLERIVYEKENNLFDFIHNAILQICEHLELRTEIRISSEIAIDHTLKSEDKVLALCDAVGADTYINPAGGSELYSKATFQQHGINLNFISPNEFIYRQWGHDFIPWLSIVDVLMFNAVPDVQQKINSGFHLI